MLLLPASLLAACGSSPPVQLYRLPSAAPVPAPGTVATNETWQLLLPVRIPDYLDRDALLMPQGEARLLALSGHRWAESLREAVPRVLREDLIALLGEGRVWVSPLPAGLTITRRLRVELQAFDVGADRRSVRLQARWSLVDPAGAQPPRSAAAELVEAAASERIDDLVAAHRIALWHLAERIVASR